MRLSQLWPQHFFLSAAYALFDMLEFNSLTTKDKDHAHQAEESRAAVQVLAFRLPSLAAIGLC